jgi:hypothetical protein
MSPLTDTQTQNACCRSVKLQSGAGCRPLACAVSLPGVSLKHRRQARIGLCRKLRWRISGPLSDLAVSAKVQGIDSTGSCYLASYG